MLIKIPFQNLVFLNNNHRSQIMKIPPNFRFLQTPRNWSSINRTHSSKLSTIAQFFQK